MPLSLLLLPLQEFYANAPTLTYTHTHTDTAIHSLSHTRMHVSQKVTRHLFTFAHLRTSGNAATRSSLTYTHTHWTEMTATATATPLGHIAKTTSTKEKFNLTQSTHTHAPTDRQGEACTRTRTHVCTRRCTWRELQLHAKKRKNSIHFHFHL